LTSGREVFCGQCVVNLVANGLKLTFALATADDKIIGETANAPEIEQEYIRGLLFQGCVNYFSCDFNSFQKRIPP